MALFRYLRPVDSVLDPHGPLLNAVPRGVIEEVNQELKKAETQPRKRGRYLFFTAEEKAKVARYGSSHGVLAAVKRFSREFEKDLKENTVRDWVKAVGLKLEHVYCLRSYYVIRDRWAPGAGRGQRHEN